MQEAGVDIGAHRGKSVTAFVRERFDLVVTLCETAAAACPPIPGAALRLHRAFDDPAFLVEVDDDLDAYRALRDDIRAYILGTVLATSLQVKSVPRRAGTDFT
jgi:arsenate reductase